MERIRRDSVEFEHYPGDDSKVFIFFPGAGNPHYENKNLPLFKQANQAGYSVYHVCHGYNGISQEDSITNEELRFGIGGSRTAKLLAEINPEAAVIVGHSLGNEHAIDTREKYPTAKLIMVNPSTNKVPKVDRFVFELGLRFTLRYGNSVMNSERVGRIMTLAGQEHYWNNARKLTSQISARSFMLGINDTIVHSHDVRKKPNVLEGGLVIHGSHDVVYDRWGDKSLLSIPETVVVDGTHSLTEKHPFKVWQAIEKYLNEEPR